MRCAYITIGNYGKNIQVVCPGHNITKSFAKYAKAVEFVELHHEFYWGADE